VLVNGVANPLNLGVAADSGVAGIDQDDLEPLVGGVLANPVGVEHAKAAKSASSTRLGDRTKVHSVLELGHTLVLGLSKDPTLVNGPLPSTTANTGAVDDKSLLGLVSKQPRLVRACGAGCTVDSVLLS